MGAKNQHGMVKNGGSGRVNKKTGRRDTTDISRQYIGRTRGCFGYPFSGDCMERMPVNTITKFCNACWFRQEKDNYLAKQKKEVA